MNLFGTRVPRVEDARMLTTGGTYVADVQDERLAGAAFVTFVRSSIAHARLLDVDVSAAGEHPHCLAVATGADYDLPPVPPLVDALNQAMFQPMLATGTVRYVGEPLAMVVTDDPAYGEDVAELVFIDYDPLTAIIDPREALLDHILLFPEAGTNVAYEASSGPGEELFEGCEVVVAAELVNQRVAPAPLEVRGAACLWDDQDRLTLWVNTQNAQASRDAVAEQLGLSRAQVRVIVPDVGGGFGAKIGIDPEPIAMCWLSRRLGRPLRWSETRSENMMAMTHGRDQRQRITIGGSRNGRLEAYRLEILQNAGAYPRIAAWLPTVTAKMATGVYLIPRVGTSVRSVVTTTTPTASYRGAGRPEATAAIERAVDLFAIEVGMDPADVRRLNFIPPESFPHTTPTGVTYDGGEYAKSLEAVLAAVDYSALRADQAERRARGDSLHLGIGLSTYVEVTAGDAATGEHGRVELHADGTVSALSGSMSQGQGHATSFAMLVADTLGVPFDAVTVEAGDTARLFEGIGTWGSRSLQNGGMAIRECCLAIVEQGRAIAAEMLETTPASVAIDPARGGWRVTGSSDRFVPWGRVAAAADSESGLAATVHYRRSLPTYPSGTHLAVVEVDLETGKVRLLRHACVDDAGLVLNPLIAEGQRHGGIAQGVAQALFEEIVFDPDGNPTTTTFADYAFISAPELPSFELQDMQTATASNDLGVKGLGEAGTIGAGPAVQNAVIDALSHLGVTHIDMPLSPLRVWEHLNNSVRGGGQ